MNILLWILFGLIAGAIAQKLMPGDDPGSFDDLNGVLITIGIGIAGALVGGFTGRLLGLGGVEGFSIRSFALAIVGALILLYAYRKYRESQ